MQSKTKIILGIDPGTIIMGYGMIKVNGNKISLLDMGILQPGKIKDPYKKLQLIFNTVSTLITKYQPECLAIEAPFFGKNIQSMLKLGRAQGVAIAAAMRHNIEVVEYTPKKIKQSITGNGNANKEQVMKMLQKILSFAENPQSFDATDALAVAVCHQFQQTSSLFFATNRIKNWKQFIAKNSGKIKS